MTSIVELDTVEGLTPLQLNKLWGEDALLVRLANKRRTMIRDPPIMSNFRVVAIILVTSPSGRHIFEGTNCEPGNYLGGSICAERAAALKARFVDGAQIGKVVLVSDSAEPISPCALCREFLISVGTRTTQLVMGSCDGEIITRCPLGPLFPHPSIYRFQGRASVEKGGLMFSSKMGNVRKAVGPELYRLYKLAFSCVKYEADTNVHGNVHPINLAAACLYSNGETDVAVQLKSLSFGVSLDPVSQLVGAMVNRIRLGYRVTTAVGDALQRGMESRVRNRSRDQRLGVVTRGYHTHNHRRALCPHCGAGRTILLDEDDDDDVHNTLALSQSKAAGLDGTSPNTPLALPAAQSAWHADAAGGKGDRHYDDDDDDDDDDHAQVEAAAAEPLLASRPASVHFSDDAEGKDTFSRPTTTGYSVKDMYGDGDDEAVNADTDLTAGIEEVTVRAVVMVDQFGIAHAPPGRARSLLTEHGFAQALVVVHSELGAVETVTADDLLPSPEGVGRLLTVEDFAT